MRSLTILFLLCVTITMTACGHKCDLPNKADCLCVIIGKEQSQNVKKSCGKMAHECFTESDLVSFISDETPSEIVKGLKKDKTFKEVVLALKQMPQEQQQSILLSCRKPLRKTWSERGEISCEGQTVAGQRAEIMIAEAVVDSVEELLKLPKEEIEKLGAGWW